MTLVTSFDQRSPHRFSVTMPLSALLSRRADFLGAVGDAAMHLADAEDGVVRAVLAAGAGDEAGFVKARR